MQENSRLKNQVIDLKYSQKELETELRETIKELNELVELRSLQKFAQRYNSRIRTHKKQFNALKRVTEATEINSDLKKDIDYLSIRRN